MELICNRANRIGTDHQNAHGRRAGVAQAVAVTAARETEVTRLHLHRFPVQGHLPRALQDVVKFLVPVVAVLTDAGPGGDRVVVDELDARPGPLVITEDLAAPQAALPAVAVTRFAQLGRR